MKVLAVTTNASLVVALGSMMREWEVVTVRTGEAAIEHGPDAAVALIDLGSTDEGVSALDNMYRGGITIPAVVLGDVPSPGARAQILVRPFSLEDLSNAVRDAAEGRGAAAGLTEEVAGPAPRDTEIAEPRPPEKLARREDAKREDIAALAGAPSPAKLAIPPGTNDRRGALSLVPPRQPDTSPVPAPSPHAEGAPAAAPASSAQPVEAPTVREPEAEQETVEEPVAEAPVIEKPAEQPKTPAPPALPPSLAHAGLTAPQTAPQRRPDEGPEAPLEQPGRRGRLRLRGQRQQVEEAIADPSIVGRLQKGAAHAQELEGLLDEMPFLADLLALADGLAGEAESQLSVQIVSVFVRGEGGFQSIANRGLSKVEAGMIVPESQPLLSDVVRTGEGFMIQPVDLAQGLVSGIGGARTEAMMAAPCMVHGRCTGIVVVGGERFNEDDLDRLSDLALEAAPGLAVAQLMERLRSR